VVIFQTAGIEGDNFEFLGWRINGVPYGALLSKTFAIAIDEDTHVRAVYNHPWAAHAATAPNTDDDEDNDDEDEEEAQPTYFVVIFERADGNMPSGVQSLQSLREGTVINPLPTPTRDGYNFAGWQADGSLVSSPFTVESSVALTAVWTNPEQTGQYVVVFNPAPGAFANTGETGMRVGDYGSTVTNMPQAPTRAGYTFDGWTITGGGNLAGQLTITGDMTLTARWTVDPSASPSPSPSPTPNPSPSPTPPPSGQSGTAPNNPQTSPLQISFMIFGFVLIAGISAYSITKITRRQFTQLDQYQSDLARFNREQRIVDMVDSTDSD